MDNGLILRGNCSYTNTISPDLHDQNLELREIDQGFRRYFVSTRVSEPPVPDPAAVPVVEFRIPQRRTDRSLMPAAIGVPQFSGFDQQGRGTVELQLAGGQTETIDVGVSTINAQYATVIGLTHDWSYGIATSSIPGDVLYPGMLSQARDFDKGGTRLNMVAALVEANQILAAQRLLDSVRSDFPDLATQVQDLSDSVSRHVSQQILTELQLRQAVGQPALAARSARLYTEQDLIPDARIVVRQLIDDLQQQQRQVTVLRTALNDQVAAVEDPAVRCQVQELLTAIDRELDLHLLPRFGAFELLAGTDGLSAEAQLALAGSGWLLGADNAVQVFPEAYGLFQIRELVLDYCRTSDHEFDRRNDLIDQIRRQEGFSIDRVAQLIPNLPVIEAIRLERGDLAEPGQFMLSETETAAGAVGIVPPEYSENREYPLLIALPREGLSALQTLAWWLPQAQRNGYIVVVPELYPPTVPEYEGTADTHRRLLELILRVKRGLRIDDNRVLIAGHGIGAEVATDVATAHPDLFAGVASIAGLGRQHLLWSAYNSADLGWYIVLGESQRFWYDRMGLLLKKLFQRAPEARRFLDVLLVRYPNRGFESYYEESPRLFEWMNLQRRALYPDQLKDIALLRSTDLSWYWLQLDSISEDLISLDGPNTYQDRPVSKGRLSASLTANNGIRLSTLPGPASVKLSPQISGLDLAKTITIIDGRQTQRIDYKPSLRDLLDEFRATADRKRLCYMRVPVGH